MPDQGQHYYRKQAYSMTAYSMRAHRTRVPVTSFEFVHCGNVSAFATETETVVWACSVVCLGLMPNVICDAADCEAVDAQPAGGAAHIVQSWCALHVVMLHLCPRRYRTVNEKEHCAFPLVTLRLAFCASNRGAILQRRSVHAGSALRTSRLHVVSVCVLHCLASHVYAAIVEIANDIENIGIGSTGLTQVHSNVVWSIVSQGNSVCNNTGKHLLVSICKVNLAIKVTSVTFEALESLLETADGMLSTHTDL